MYGFLYSCRFAVWKIRIFLVNRKKYRHWEFWKSVLSKFMEFLIVEEILRKENKSNMVSNMVKHTQSFCSNIIKPSRSTRRDPNLSLRPLNKRHIYSPNTNSKIKNLQWNLQSFTIQPLANKETKDKRIFNQLPPTRSKQFFVWNRSSQIRIEVPAKSK